MREGENQIPTEISSDGLVDLVPPGPSVLPERYEITPEEAYQALQTMYWVAGAGAATLIGTFFALEKFYNSMPR